MGIQNFPLALQAAIQQGFLEREFQEGLASRLGYRAIADREKIAAGIGETLTKTRAGLLPAVTVPLAAASNTNLDNGLTPVNWGVEQYTLAINLYAATTDLNMVTSRVGIASQFLQNAKVNGEQAARSLDELARNALFGPYFGGNTRVNATLGSAGAVVSVDDIRGFTSVQVYGVPAPVSASNGLLAVIGSDTYTIVAAAADTVNISTAPDGISGKLTLSANVTVADATAGNTVTASTASTILRPAGRGNTAALQATDSLTMANLLDAVTVLRNNAVPEADGAYNCYLDPVSARQLFADPDFRQLFQGATSANAVFRRGMVNDFLGLRFITTTEAFLQPHPSLSGLLVRRPIVCGQGALVEGDFAGMAADDVKPDGAIVHMIDDVAMVTREPIDRLQQIIAQSWYWIGGFCAPTDATTNSSTIPTASNAAYKRAVMIEHIG